MILTSKFFFAERIMASISRSFLRQSLNSVSCLQNVIFTLIKVWYWKFIKWKWRFLNRYFADSLIGYVIERFCSAVRILQPFVHRLRYAIDFLAANVAWGKVVDLETFVLILDNSQYFSNIHDECIPSKNYLLIFPDWKKVLKILSFKVEKSYFDQIAHGVHFAADESLVDVLDDEILDLPDRCQSESGHQLVVLQPTFLWSIGNQRQGAQLVQGRLVEGHLNILLFKLLRIIYFFSK